MGWFGCLGLAAMLLAACALEGEAAPVIWRAPAGEPLWEEVTLRVDGRPAPVHACRVSAVPLNQVWPGYQRPMDQTEIAGFATWGMAAPVTVEVTAKRPFRAVAVRPSSRGIRPAVRGRTVTFRVDRPGPLTVEFDGPRGALHLFPNPPETGAPRPDTPKVRYFGPGVHRPGKIALQSGETLYVAGGAVVHTAVSARGATGVRILGRGVIDTSEYEREKGGGCIRLEDCSDVRIEGVILRDPDVWCLSAFGCRNLTIANVKLVGLWRYNADGIDLCNSQDAEVRDCFVRAFDDAIVLKGLRWEGGYHERPVRDIRVSRCVIWCDWGRALEIGAETSAPEFAEIAFRDCDVIRTTHIAMDLQCGDRALVRDVTFENIRVEIDPTNPAPKMQSSREEQYRDDQNGAYVPNLMVIVIAGNPYSKDAERGRVRDIVFRDIRVTGGKEPDSWFRGFDAEHDVAGVLIENLTVNGKRATSVEAARLSVGPHVNGVRVVSR